MGMNETDPERARQIHLAQMAAQRESGDLDGIATAAQFLGLVASRSGDYQQAIACFQESLSSYRQVGNHWSVANQLQNLGLNAWYQGDYAQADLNFSHAIAIFRDVGDYG